jgi:hypothetical protein
MISPLLIFLFVDHNSKLAENCVTASIIFDTNCLDFIFIYFSPLLSLFVCLFVSAHAVNGTVQAFDWHPTEDNTMVTLRLIQEATIAQVCLIPIKLL